MFKKITIMLMLALLVTTAWARDRGLVYHEIEIVDELGRPVTNITDLYIYYAGTNTNAVIYMDRNLLNEILIPMTEASDNTTLIDGRAHWWGQDGWDFSVTNDDAVGPMTNANHEGRNASDMRLIFPSYFSSMATTAWGDAQSISMGTGPEWVVNGGGVANTLSFIPTGDNFNFIVGSINPAFTSSFYVPTGATDGLVIAAAAFTWDGGAVLLNNDSDFNIGLCTGTSTGGVTIGNALGGPFSLETDSTITILTDDAIAVTNTVGAADQVYTTAGNFQIIATEAGSLTAVNIDITGAVSGFDLDTTNGPIVMTAGDAGNGDITLEAADVMTFTSVDWKMFDGAVPEVWRMDGTAGTFYHSFSFTDATGNIVWTFPDIGTGAGDTLAIVGSTFVTNYPEVAGSVWFAENDLIFEGAAADAFQMTITVVDPTVDNTMTLSDDTGSFAYTPLGTVDRSGPGAIAITHAHVTLESTGGADACQLADGVNGQIIVINHDTDGGDVDITPNTATGYTSINLDADGDMVSLMWIDTTGWIILGGVNTCVVTP